MRSIPDDIALTSLPGPSRGDWPALYFRDEIVWAPSKNHFSLAYTIAEASMMNDIGCVLWASFDENVSTIPGNPQGVYACCWYSPWCIWIDENTFVFKAQHYHREKLHLPIVAIHVNKGFAVVPDSDNADTRPNTLQEFDGPFQPVVGDNLLHAIRACK